MTYDRNFDGISGKFANNIYGTTKGRLRHELLIHHLEANNVLVDLKSKRVIDVGCGLGHMWLWVRAYVSISKCFWSNSVRY